MALALTLSVLFLVLFVILLLVSLLLLVDLRRPKRFTTDSERQEERFFAEPGPRSRPWSRR
jgi:hypothetical protein